MCASRATVTPPGTAAATAAAAAMVVAAAAAASARQGLTLVHFLAQRERFLLDRGCN